MVCYGVGGGWFGLDRLCRNSCPGRSICGACRGTPNRPRTGTDACACTDACTDAAACTDADADARPGANACTGTDACTDADAYTNAYTNAGSGTDTIGPEQHETPFADMAVQGVMSAVFLKSVGPPYRAGRAGQKFVALHLCRHAGQQHLVVTDYITGRLIRQKSSHATYSTRPFILS